MKKLLKKLLVVLLAVSVSMFLFIPRPARAAISLVANVAAGSTTGDNVTTAGINTTSANFIVLFVSSANNTGVTVSDSQSNSWIALTNSVLNPDMQAFYVVSPSTSASHTFTLTSTGQFPSVAVLAFSGVSVDSPFDLENGAIVNPGTSLQPGSVTPSENGEVLVTGISSQDTTGMAIDSSFTITDTINLVSNQHFGISAAYKIQTTAAAENPTWSWTVSGTSAARIATFKKTSNNAVVTNGTSILINGARVIING